ncbi:amino acid transporter [Metamycoplasma subdolum]|uniref:Amino acid transporter n=1 Tax=Metamycoplasma subdolum TaxID=92407 RepID=A0A3M0A7N8_9BACT|nr:APC family permease [Metamycoplasma subdolum]RMA78485.1 amino acid transporter [Metamycoplasma subdolum]WPB50417.1 APC family permease [Metamycoplasma subdolum]
MNDEQLVVTSDNKKKIGFFSAILIVIGGSIGAGIFLRSKSVLENSAGNIIWALLMWLIAGFAVVCMALALVEVASGRNDNLGMIGWSKAFNGVRIYKANKFFMTYLYLPFTYFFMPYYAIVQFQDALTGFGVKDKIVKFSDSEATPWIYFALGLVLSVWFIFSAGLSGKAANIQNWIITSVKFIPLLAVVIIGMYYLSKNGVNQDLIKLDSNKLLTSGSSLFKLTPFFAVFGSLGGIFFAFDGFYVAAGMQTEMKNPEKTPAALAIGLMTITGIYMLIALSMTLGVGGTATPGDFYGLGGFLESDNVYWIFGVINLFISIGILGILNGFSGWATRFVEDLIKEGEIVIPVKAYKYMKNAKLPLVGALFTLILSLPYMIIFTVIGAYAYFGGNYGPYYGKRIDELLTFSDLMADWMAVFAFVFIALAIYGAIKNRKQHFIAVKENKNTLWAGWTSVIIVLLVAVMLILDKLVAVGLSLNAFSLVKDEDTKHAVMGSCIAVALFIVYMAICFGSPALERKVAEAKEIKLQEAIRNAQGEELENLLLAKEMNDLVLKSYREARA